MVIDFHTHVFADKIVKKAISQLEGVCGVKASTDGRVEGLLASMEEAGIDCSVILPVVTAPKQFKSINQFAWEINRNPQPWLASCDVSRSSGLQDGEGTLPRLVAFGGIHPDSEDYRGQLRELKSRGFQGIKLHPDYQGVFFNDIRCKRIVGYAAELDMAVVVHGGVDIGMPEPVHCTPQMAAEVLKETQAHKLVLAHLGGWELWDAVEEYLVGSAVYLDTAFIPDYIAQEQFVRIVQNHGSERILFATDSPWLDQKRGVDWLKGCGLPQEDMENIFYRTALKLIQ